MTSYHNDPESEKSLSSRLFDLEDDVKWQRRMIWILSTINIILLVSLLLLILTTS